MLNKTYDITRNPSIYQINNEQLLQLFFFLLDRVFFSLFFRRSFSYEFLLTFDIIWQLNDVLLHFFLFRIKNILEIYNKPSQQTHGIRKTLYVRWNNVRTLRICHKNVFLTSCAGWVIWVITQSKHMTLKRRRLDVVTISRNHNNVQMTSF